MTKVELLAPAGDFDSLKAAIALGANAIYIGGTHFGARAFAHNFTLEEIQQAVSYAHLRNVRIFVTVNTLIMDDEIEAVLGYIGDLYRAQVDAILIQDIGLLHLIRRYYPELECHISTQMTLHSPYGLSYFEELGVKRIVVSRETSIDEIKYIVDNTSMEVEVFVHGALCVCYSGACHMSFNIGGRSGNRGACAQPCRMRYSLDEDGQIIGESHYLSPKDLMTLEHVDELIDAGVSSFKIEGRMKKPEYVAAAVKCYRRAIDHYYDGTDTYQQQDIDDLSQMFNREYTNGWLFKDSKIVKGDFPGHHGTIIGQVTGYSKKRKTVRIKLNHTLKQGDSILFEDIDQGRPVNKMMVKGLLVNKASDGDEVEIEFNHQVIKGKVRKTVSIDTTNRLQKDINQAHPYRKINMSLFIRESVPLTLTGFVDGIKIVVKGEICRHNDNGSTLSTQRLQQQLRKTGGTIYEVDQVNIKSDNQSFIKISEINQLRRQLLAQFDDYFQNQIINPTQPDVSLHQLETINARADSLVIVHTIEQLEEALKMTPNVYIDYDSRLYNEAIACFTANDVVPGFNMPRIVRQDDYQALVPLLSMDHRYIVNEYSLYVLLRETNPIIGTGFNIFNSYSADCFKTPVIASYELDPTAVNVIKQTHNAYTIVYGRDENMVSEHCVISQHYFKEKRPHCHMCERHSYELIDHMNSHYPILTDEHCRMHVLNKDIRRLKPDANSLNVIIFTNENEKETQSVLSYYHKFL